MDPLLLLFWCLSVVCATLFFAAGYLVCSHVRSVERYGLEARLARATHGWTRARSDCEQLRVELDTARGELDRVARRARGQAEANVARHAEIERWLDSIPAPAEPPRSRVVDLRPDSFRSSSDRGTVEGVIDTRLGELLGGQRQAAVLADAHGLIVAGVGDDDERRQTMAAVAPLAVDLCRRAQGYLQFRRVIRLELDDARGQAFRVRLFEWADQLLVLTSLGRAEPRLYEDEESVVSVLPTLLNTAS